MKTLGQLEERIMGVLWRRGSPSTVREVHEELNAEAGRPLAYTTVMTVMDRLWRKGLLRRQPRGRAYQYLPSRSEAEYTAALMHSLLSATRDRRSVLAHFVRGMRRGDETELLRLAGEAARSRRKP